MRIGEAGRIAAAVGGSYAARFGLERDAAFHLGKLTEDLGELQAAWLKLNGRARGQGSREAVEDEAADVLGFLLLFCDWQGLDLEAAFRRKWAAHLSEGEQA
ncbi:MAG: hypothetical protein R3D63_00845 [Paracoccaceae bacterium]